MSDDLDRIHQALERDGYYVDPALRADVTDAQLTALSRALAETDRPTYVVIYPLRDGDEYSGSGIDLLVRLHDRYGEPGVYLGTTRALAPTDYSTIELAGRQWGLPGEPDGDLTDYELLYAVSEEDPPDLGTAFVRAVELQNAGPEAIHDAYEAARDHSYDDSYDAGTSTTTGDGSDPGTDLTGAGVGVGVTAVLVALLAGAVWVVVRRRGRRGGARPARAGSALPAAALERIREARDRRWEAEARAGVLALGAEVDRVRIDTDTRRERWQVAQDHYVAARDLLEGPVHEGQDGPDVLDVVGALVLVARGRSALDALARGRTPWTPPPVCFFHPLHDAATERLTGSDVPSARTGVDVTVCPACRRAVTAGETPDTLTVERRGRDVPYYATDAEPWASTGYGALDDDLLGALARDRP